MPASGKLFASLEPLGPRSHICVLLPDVPPHCLQERQYYVDMQPGKPKPRKTAAVLLLTYALFRSPFVAARCDYGAVPGAWVRSSWPRVQGRGSHPDYNRLDNTSSSVWLEADSDEGGAPFGEAWTSLDPRCRLHNYVAPLVSRTSQLARNVTIVLLGDSIDAQLLDFVCAEYWRRGGTRAFAYVHSHKVTNYCHIGDAGLGTQLTLVQMYIIRSSLEDDTRRVDSVARVMRGNDSDASLWFDGTNRSVLESRPAEISVLSTHIPDLVVVGGVYWPLHRFAEAHGDTLQTLLPIDQIKEFIRDTTRLVHLARVTFPAAHVVVRTSPQIRTDCNFGSNVDNANKRTWGRRMYVDALNNGIVQVAKATRADIVDAHAMASGWQPSQVTGDDVHPRSWFQFELLNVYLNILSASGKLSTLSAATNTI